MYIVLALVFALIVYIILEGNHEKNTYYQQTENSLFNLRNDSGAKGEYNIYKQLAYLENERNKFLFNLYIPKMNGETAEIDAVYISPKGMFVLESKNYSGWIFGNDSQKTWTQTLPGRWGVEKYHFYNPVWQNESHISVLREHCPSTVPVYSIIVFSGNCEFKNLTINRLNTKVVKSHELSGAISELAQNSKIELTDAAVNSIYNSLLSYTHADIKTKNKHINDVQKYK